MLYKIALFLLLLLPSAGFAFHLRAGEITYRAVPGIPYTYEITVNLYTNIGLTSPDMPDLITAYSSFSFGDNSPVYNVPRTNGMGEKITPIILKNVYTIIHTYPGNGNYIISLTAAYRNFGINNIPMSENNSMYVASLLTISDQLKPISSPILTFPPIGEGCTNTPWSINPGAIDPDGDLLKFRLIKCETSNGLDIPGFVLPQALDPTGNSIFTIDSLNGTILWDRPTSLQGDYNIAIKTEKWRNGKLVGYVIRDMQITIHPCVDNPPVLYSLPNLCVVAGKNINYNIASYDVNMDTLSFVTSGTPYTLQNNPATYTLTGTNIGAIKANFNWNTNISHIRLNPYQVFYKVIDSHNGIHLQANASNFINIVASAVQNVNATVNQIRNFNVTWDPSVYPEATGYNIYRRQGNSSFIFDSCTAGVPSGSGYALVGKVTGQQTISYIDSDKGNGLPSGYIYCYIVTAVFPNGVESVASKPFCASLMYSFIKVIKDTLISCVGTTLTIDSTIIKFLNADSKTIYKWSASPELTLTNANKQDVRVTMNKIGSFDLKIVAISGSYSDSATIHIKVYQPPIAKIKFKEMGGMPDSVMFYNLSSNSINALWSFPNGTVSSKSDSVLYVFDKYGNYKISLMVLNTVGCPDIVSIDYNNIAKGISMPNAFEPENSHIELKKFRPATAGIKSCYFGIWDLWGNLVWETYKNGDFKLEDGWDGNNKKGGKMAPQTFVWRIKATFIDGTVWKGIKDRFGNYHTEGSFVLLR